MHDYVINSLTKQPITAWLHDQLTKQSMNAWLRNQLIHQAAYNCMTTRSTHQSVNDCMTQLLTPRTRHWTVYKASSARLLSRTADCRLRGTTGGPQAKQWSSKNRQEDEILGRLLRTNIISCSVVRGNMFLSFRLAVAHFLHTWLNCQQPGNISCPRASLG